MAYKVEGDVKQGASFVARTVSVFNTSGVYIGSVVSNATTGVFSITVPSGSDVDVICHANSSTTDNDLIYRVTPVSF